VTDGVELHGIPGGRARPSQHQVASQDLVCEAEESVVSALLLDASRMPEVLGIVQPEDFADARLRPIVRATQALCERGEPVDLVTVHAELARAGNLDAAGGLHHLGEVSDVEATSANVVAHARLVRRFSIERQLRGAYEEAAAGSRDAHLRELIEILEDQLDELEAGAGSLTELGLSGARLEALRARPEPESPLPGLLDSLPSLVLLQGRPKVAKTTLALALSQAWCQGIAPWPGAPDLPGSRAFILSAEQPAARIDATLRRLGVFAKRGSSDLWTRKLTVIARDAELPVQGRRLLCLDDEGLGRLRQALVRARESGAPYGLGILDSLSRLKPPGLEENSADDMAGWLGQLQSLAEELELYLKLVHHVGHAGRDEAAGAGRGSSAIAAVAQTLWLLERVPGIPRQRVLKIQGNDVLAAELTFEVAGEKAEPGSVDYFRPVDPLQGNFEALPDLVGRDEEIPTGELARRLQVRATGKRPKNEASGPYKSQAAALREQWRRRGLVTVVEGGEGQATTLRRRAANEPV